MPRSFVPGGLLTVLGIIGLGAVAACLVVVLGGAPLWGAAQDVAGAREVRQSPKVKELRARLDQPIALDSGIPAGSGLKDALDYLSEKHGVTFIIDTPAFALIGVPQPEQAAVQLPKMVNVSLATVLRLMLAQVKNDLAGATYRLREGHVEITTTLQASATPTTTVDVVFERQPLDVSLHELTEMTGSNIVVDIRVADKARKPVTATLNQVSVETAVRVLADMANLKLVVLEDVLYVTSLENGKELLDEQERREARKPRPERTEPLGRIRVP